MTWILCLVFWGRKRNDIISTWLTINELKPTKGRNYIRNHLEEAIFFAGSSRYWFLPWYELHATSWSGNLPPPPQKVSLKLSKWTKCWTAGNTEWDVSWRHSSPECFRKWGTAYQLYISAWTWINPSPSWQEYGETCLGQKNSKKGGVRCLSGWHKVCPEEQMQQLTGQSWQREAARPLPLVSLWLRFENAQFRHPWLQHEFEEL